MNCEPDNLSGKGTIVFLAVNASYAHTNLAGWYLRGIAERAGWTWHEVEVTRNDSLMQTLHRVLQLKPVVLAASFYLFNTHFLISVISRFKAMSPDCLVIGGGPEFLADNFCFLQRHPEINAVIRGEGEQAFAAWLEVCRMPGKWKDVKGLCAFIDGKYTDNGKAELTNDLDAITSPFNGSLNAFKKPFLLMETSRGCSGKCAFCTSAGEKVRFFSLERVVNDLSLISSSGVGEVRIADRTFNENPARCVALIKIMREQFKGVRFHLEIDPARLLADVFRELILAQPGQFHLEVGIQTTRLGVLRRIGRVGPVERALSSLNQVCSMKNISVHVDLIAGLPGTGLVDLYADLRTVAMMQPDEIQLELLKILPGTGLSMETEKYGIIAAGEPPYEILQTMTMSHDDMVAAQRLSSLVDWFYNPPELHDFFITAAKLVPDFFERMADFCGGLNGALQSPSLENRFRFLEQFCRLNAPALIPKLGYAWLKRGLSAQHGICRVTQWKKQIPRDAVLIEGDGSVDHRRVYLAELDRPYLFVYGHCSGRAGAIYALERPC